MPRIDEVMYGSCVTRDAFEFAPKGTFRRSAYVARQSMISIDRPAAVPALETFVLDSRFQNRLFHGDLRGDAIDRVVESAAKIAHDDLAIVVDLVDERGGIFLHPSGAVLTRTIDGHDSGAYELLDDEWTLHGFGSMKHWTLYAAAAERTKERLQEAGLFDRVRVLTVKWAERDETGADTRGSFGFFASTANEVLEGYYETLRNGGWRLIAPEAQPVADAHHKWGAAPFHYTREYYDAINAAIVRSYNE